MCHYVVKDGLYCLVMDEGEASLVRTLLGKLSYDHVGDDMWKKMRDSVPQFECSVVEICMKGAEYEAINKPNRKSSLRCS